MIYSKIEGGEKVTIGENIRKIRKEKGLTQKALGKLCGINEANIRKYEINSNITPQLKTIEKIATALEVKVADLMGISDYLDEVEKEIHETTSFKDYLGILGYEIHESPYDDKWVINIKKSNTEIYISSEEMDTLERTTKENIDLRITKYISDGKHNQ